MVQTVVTKAFQQFVISQPYASLGREGFAKILGQQETIFDHFLNFNSFTGEGVTYAKAEGTFTGKMVYEQSWDAQGLPLGIYFQYMEDSISLSVLYNRYSIG